MERIQTLRNLKELLQANFEDNEAVLAQCGQTRLAQLKAYLLEANHSVGEIGCPSGSWSRLDATGWYINRGGQSPGTFFLDATRKRVWILYTILDATEADSKGSSCNPFVEEIPGKMLIEPVQGTPAHMIG